MKDSTPLTVWQKPRRFTPEYQKWFATKVVEHYIELLRDKVGDDWHLAKADLLTFIEKDCNTEDIKP